MATPKVKTKTKFKGKTFTITKENRVTNSPFFIEGTDMVFDVPHEFPLPTETTGFDEDGNPVALRFIASCSEIDKNKQIQLGYPEKRKPTQTERDLLTFLGGMLTVPEGYGHLENFLLSAPWWSGEPGKEHERKRPPNTRAIYEEYNQERIDDEAFDTESLITEARQIVQKADKDTVISLLRLSRPGAVIDPNLNVKQAKLDLLGLANNNPDFIIKGHKSAKTDMSVIVSKAIDYGILNVDFPRTVKIKAIGTDKYETLAQIADVGGRNAKIERVNMYLESPEGRAAYSELKTRVKQHEETTGLLEEDEEDDETGGQGLHTTTTTTRAPEA